MSDIGPDGAIPLFNPIQGLADALKERRISIVPVLVTQEIWSHTGRTQLHCYSPAAFPALAERIAIIGSAVRFVTLALPTRNILAVQTYLYLDIWVRYIAAYDTAHHARFDSDRVVGRWDVLVERA